MSEIIQALSDDLSFSHKPDSLTITERSDDLNNQSVADDLTVGVIDA